MLWILAVFADRSDVPLPSGVRFDATIALMLLCVALAGPLPALGIFFVPVLVNAITGHERLLRAGNLANLASNGWQALAAGAVLALVAGPSFSPARSPRSPPPGRCCSSWAGPSARPSTARCGSATRCARWCRRCAT